MKFITNAIRIIFLFISAFSFLNETQAQLYNEGGSITITSGASIYTSDVFTNTANGTVTNNGSITSNTDIINDAGSTFSGDGVYNIQRDLTSRGKFYPDNSTLNFFGSLNSDLKNVSGSINILQVNKSANYYINFTDNETVLQSVDFLSDKNFIKLNNKNITLNGNCVVNNYNNKRYFLTNGIGVVKKVNVGTAGFTFPVGYDRNTYNPLAIIENGVADAYSVRCLQHALLNGGSGDTIATGGINASWFVSEDVAGGANAIVQGTWKINGDELTGFNYAHCEVARNVSGTWNYSNALAGTATQSSGYRTISRNGFTSFGYFTVLSSANPTFAKNIFIADNAIAANSKFKIYPTVVQNNINIDVPLNKAATKMNITIVDAKGNTVWQKPNADFGSQKIFIPDFASGMYMVNINYNDQQFVQKIIISH